MLMEEEGLLDDVDKNRFDEISVRLFKPLRLFSIHLILVSHQAPSVPAIGYEPFVRFCPEAYS